MSYITLPFKNICYTKFLNSSAFIHFKAGDKEIFAKMSKKRLFLYQTNIPKSFSVVLVFLEMKKVLMDTENLIYANTYKSKSQERGYDRNH